MLFIQRQRKKRKELPPRYLLLIMTILCLIILVLGRLSGSGTNILSYAAYHVIVPMQEAINKAGSGLNDLSLRFASKKELEEKNQALEQEVEELRARLNQVETDQHEYEELQALFDTKQAFSEYETREADVVAADSSNWFSTFMINRGSRDGIKTGMNVIAQGGLAGIVIDVGANSAKVRAIVDDSSSISAMDAASSELFLVNGSLKLMNQSRMIEFSDLRITEDPNADADRIRHAKEGDKVVTSAISDRYLKGIPIGYIASVQNDNGNLSQSGTIIPMVDFAHLEHVLVIMETKSDSGSGARDGN